MNPQKKSAVCLASLIAALGGTQAYSQTYQYPFQNPGLPIEVRVHNVDSLLTPAEKYSLLPENEPAISRLGLNAFTFYTEGIHGLAWGPGGTYTATQFPQGFGLGETWDTAVMQQAGGVIGREVRIYNNAGKCGLVLRSPNADLARDPRWGRTEETYGEDPFLIGKLAAGLITGLRGNNAKYIMAASMCKHFCANSNEANRTSSSSNFDQRLLREYYAKSFEIALMEGGAQSYMTAYNAVNGVHCIWNPVLKNMTRHDWGFDGAVCSDYQDLTTSSGYATVAQKVAAAIRNGSLNAFDDPLGTGASDAINGGLMTINDVDTVVRNAMRVRIRLGDLDSAAWVPYKTLTGTPWTGDSSKALAKLVTQKSIVLLKNANNTLPLDKTTIKSIAIIGPRADSVISDYYGGKAPYTISILSGIKTKLGTGVTVNFARDNTNGTAVNYARSADAAIVCIGNDPLCGAGWATCPDASAGKEAVDRQQITVEADQETLVEQVFAANPKTIVVLVSSFPYAITWENANIPAIVHIANSSQELGSAMANVLFGDYNPAGRLSMTWPQSLTQVPTMMDYNIRDGRTYMYFTGTPLFPFGYGLSYTTFSYANLQISSPSFDARTGVTVSVDVKNTGAGAGEEVVQMYVKHLNSAVVRPQKELRGFQRVALTPGQTKTVSLFLPGKNVAYWDSTQATWFVECDNLQIQVGASSADIRLNSTIPVINCGPITTAVMEQSPGASGEIRAPAIVSVVRVIQKGAMTGLLIHMNRASDIDLRMFKLDGGLMFHVTRKELTAGDNFIPLGAVTPAPGVYLVTANAGAQKIVTKWFVR